MAAADSGLWDRWEEVDRLLDEALDLPEQDRFAHIERRTIDDPSLRSLVLRLVARLERDTERLIRLPQALVLEAFGSVGDRPASSDLTPGTSVGRYRITGWRGRGGMATVYEAERTDGVYEQKVALKVLRRGLDTEDLIRRFLTERQILSALTHPSIARLLDGGSLPDGRPYLVMELVDGSPITTFADARRLDLRARLDLFLEVADAVHAAHRRLVVHRDIKPSNILVDQDGHAKLLDFGIAKLLDAEIGNATATERVLTPDYASPEQLRGDPITTGTDVYQLGLLLRELLTGLPPRQSGSAPTDPPTRPSRAAREFRKGIPPPDVRAAARRTTPDRLSRTLAGDLDLIISTALRPEPHQRYGSAEDLAADVRRHLRGLPILAHPESLRYRIRKFIGRHPLFLPGAAVIVVATLAFIGVITVQNRRLVRERDAADRASRRAHATQSFLVDLLKSPDPTSRGDSVRSRDLTVVEALRIGRERVATELADQPELRVALLEAIGQTYSGLGYMETADTLLEGAVDLARETFGENSEELAAALFARGDHVRTHQNFERADSLYQAALRLWTATASVSDTALATRLGALASVRRDLRDVDSALVLANRAMELRQAAGDTAGVAYVGTLQTLAFVLRGAQLLDSAERVYRDVLHRQERLPGISPYDVALTYNNLGFLLRTRKDFAGAEASYREAFRIMREVVGDAHPLTFTVSGNLAAALELQGKVDATAEVGSDRVRAAERQWPDGHWRVGEARMAQGRLLLRHDRPAEALRFLEGGVASLEQTLGRDHGWTAVARTDLAVALLLLGRTIEADAAFRRAEPALTRLGARLDPGGRLRLEQAASILEARGHGDWARRIRRILAGEPPNR